MAPLYQYQCKQCENEIEAVQKFSDDPLKQCESCGGELKKIISAPKIELKGNGWHNTDYPKTK